ncbi:hypothetical protein N9N12_00370 [Candidatus Poseidoniales archaeon]|jgi:hypothetical protein|nr:hypothetical protein [Candidatus Poseidoniales archaeon]MDA8832652.1 hypothetical protein [Candidatus Poseidoniales archaeon]
MTPKRHTPENENRLKVNAWYTKHQPLRQTRFLVTGLEASVESIADLFSWKGGVHHIVLHLLSTCAELRFVHLGNAILAGMETGDDPFQHFDDMVVEFSETITEGLLGSDEAPFAWIHVGHGDHDGHEAFLSDGSEGEGPYLETAKIAEAIEAMKGTCSYICLPVCHSLPSKLALEACENTALVFGSAEDIVTEINTQCIEATLNYAELKSRMKSVILGERHA